MIKLIISGCESRCGIGIRVYSNCYTIKLFGTMDKSYYASPYGTGHGTWSIC